ncbi:MAG: hypothetical protein KBD63_01970 [Bacteriovoracaceae bacterium]|nr:hypothetical protein [Bacteriovoracaceae bacterium]
MQTEYLNSFTESWIESLALDELNMEESGVIHFNEHLDTEKYLEEATLSYMEYLRDRFELYVQKFNELRTSKTQLNSIKIFKISNTESDFMLFRNSLKLIVSKSVNGIVSIGFLSNSGGLFSARLNHETPAINMAHEIKAHVGPFHTLSWRFNGEPVDTDALIRHYLTEFIKHSAR